MSDFSKEHGTLLTLVYIAINCLSIRAHRPKDIYLPLALARRYTALLKLHIHPFEMLDVKFRHDDKYLESPNW